MPAEKTLWEGESQTLTAKATSGRFAEHYSLTTEHVIVQKGIVKPRRRSCFRIYDRRLQDEIRLTNDFADSVVAPSQAIVTRQPGRPILRERPHRYARYYDEVAQRVGPNRE